MKNTFKHIYSISGKFLVSASLLLGLGSCNEEFLKPDPLSFYEPAVTFTTEAGLESTLAMCDRHIRTYWTYYQDRDRALPISTEYMFSEEAVAAMTDNSGVFADIASTLTPTNAISDNDQNGIAYFWNEHFLGIKHANTVISYVDKVEGLDENTKKTFLGRAYFHRAFRYLALVFQFNDVPLISKLVQGPKFDYKSTKREAILEMITLDMEKAVEYVPEQSEMDYIGMVSKGACRQLLIKCYLATGQWQKAIEQADILINESGYSLMMDSFGVFQDPKEATWPITRNVIWDLHRPVNKCASSNTETILGLPNMADTDASIKMRSMRNWLPLLDNRWELKSPAGVNAIRYTAPSWSSYDENLDYRTAYGRGIAHIRPTYYYTHQIWNVNNVEDAGDLRHSSTVGNWVKMTDLKYNNSSDEEWYGKNLQLYDDNGNILCQDTIRCWFDWPHYKMYVECPTELTSTNANHRGGAGDWYCYRLAETYLLRAEAKFYNGDATGAAEDVNKVRERAGCEQLFTTVTIGDIMDERARELYLEEWRHMELSRVSYCLAMSGKADEWGNTYDVNTLASDSYWWNRVNGLNGFYNKANAYVWQQSNRPYTIAPNNIYWPIPQYAINANREGVLSQNPGYDGYDPNVDVWTNWEDAVADE
ncbi:RagB/SusD family nutrient uptake outer membrane protein [Plebeiibacterium sediminum]|uniref:RagB/SusD family nutrient uptake outer membrane protein n=1 Tax=Plebeiibacterium sediminum TaxID=2992112 RepID=A0AAE3M0Y7_9BACT|nr:RagB/SusD family nutrient uptake outer membrane protein [Plebeiobacterium sediminum]MCW3785246.1 RagB/SusD family nutrient uptake outer membrane protein [Plebeiobacterium sediminum]